VTKAQRLILFMKRLRACAPVGSHNAAFDLIRETLNLVEDEFSEAPYRPEFWQEDGRMYPPDPKYSRREECSSTIEYRSLRQSTFIGENGAFSIVDRKSGRVLLAKAGLDGLRLKMARRD
jgi:hypothetical protein